MKVKIASEEGLKFPHSNSWESADTVFTNVGGGEESRNCLQPQGGESQTPRLQCHPPKVTRHEKGYQYCDKIRGIIKYCS